MALLKTEAEKLSLPFLQAGVIDNIVTSDELFAVVPFMPFEGKTYDYNRELSLGSAEWYDVNDTLGESAATFTKKSAELKRLIGQVDVDEYLQTQDSDTNDQAATQIAKKSKVVGRTFANTMINGDVAINAKQFDGMRKTALGLPASQLDASPVAGEALSYDFLDWLIDQAYIALQRALGGTTPETVSVGGMVFNAYRGRPILKNDWMPTDEDYEGYSAANTADWAATTAYVLKDRVVEVTSPLGTVVFECTTAGTSGASEPTWDTTPGNTTSDGTVTWTCRSAALASIFLASFDEDEGWHGLVSKNKAGVGVEDLGPLEDKDARRYRVKWYTACCLKSELAMARKTGVNN
jgi:hypothetical protein